MNNEEWKGYINDLAEGIPTPEQIQQRKFREENLQNCYRAGKYISERLNLKVSVEATKEGTYECINVCVYTSDTVYKRISIPFDDIETDVCKTGKPFEEAVFDNLIHLLLSNTKYM